MAKDLNKRELLKKYPQLTQFQNGCLIDTSVLFGASLDTDIFNEDAIQLIDILTDTRIPKFINVNIRAEFLNNARRTIVAEAALDLYEDYGSQLPEKIYNKLRSLQNRSEAAKKTGKSFRVQEEEIKQIKALFKETGSSFNEPIWEMFSSNYLHGKLQAEWDRVENEMGINTISFSDASSDNILTSDLSWKEVTHIIEASAASSSDAMIINLFNASKIKLIFTADEDFANVVSDLSDDDKVVCCL